MKIVAASDLHIGYEGTNYANIHRLLDYTVANADKLILCGDIFDFWRCSLDDIRKYAPTFSVYNKLVEISNQMDVVIIKGNHDSTLNDSVFNISKPFEFQGIYYTHGWEFDVEQCIGSPFFNFITEYFPNIYKKFFKTPFEVQAKSDVYNTQIKAIDMVAKRYAEQYDYLVMGHTHYPEIDGKLVNCGDLVDSSTYIEINDGIPKLVML
ncbi:metallophosphoesterase [Bacteroides sp.]|uniref:metallophosphoesterase n=1 Tax=Bacteroides sp. TaxID=29523 RepID=UPI00262B6BAC|nr:metallophosphoesterase [Bacteroides sp.]MDD3039629.1 metallophosphoesterase family protein [Bacteroides sp.]